jgi:MFS superfamily sulfate permease-like transporter
VFANAAFFTERMAALIANAGPGLKCVILDAEAISDFDSTAADALETLDYAFITSSQQALYLSTNATPITSICRHHPCPRPAFTPYPTHSPTPPASSASIPLAQLLPPRRRQRPGPLPALRPGCTRLQTEPSLM